MDAPHDTAYIGYDMYTMLDLFDTLELTGYTYIVQPQNKRVVTSKAALARLTVIMYWRDREND